jgi:aminoglycoside phosphotransferase (APT) family kinase protein
MTAAGLGPTALSAVRRELCRVGVDVVGELRCTRIAGGRSNQTFRLDDAARSWVLRMPPSVGRTPSAHDVAREFTVTKALQATDVPAPSPVLLADESVIGLPFAVADFVPGHTVQTRTELDKLDDGQVAGCVDVLVETLAALHGVDHESVGLASFGRPEGYAARQVRRWADQWEIVGNRRLDQLSHGVTASLRRLLPEQRSVGVIHGDYRIDNTLLDLTGAPRIAAVVDWELSTLGDPVADVAMMCVYRHPALDLVLGSPSAWTSERLPDASGLASAYERAGGVELIDWESHLALGHLKLAVIAAGIEHRYKAGATDDPGHARAGEAVEPLLAEAEDLLVGRAR